VNRDANFKTPELVFLFEVNKNYTTINFDEDANWKKLINVLLYIETNVLYYSIPTGHLDRNEKESSDSKTSERSISF